MEIILERKWGEPKLKKPKFLNNKTLLGSVVINKHCKGKLWKYEDNLYLLHRDWFSSWITAERAVELGIIDKTRNSKFVYDDGERNMPVVLRNEAILKLIPDDFNDGVYGLCCKLENLLNLKFGDLHFYEWEHLFEQICELGGYSPIGCARRLGRIL